MKLRAAAPAVLILAVGGLVAWFCSSFPPPPLAPVPLPAPVLAPARADLSMVDGLCRLPDFVTEAAAPDPDKVVRPPLLPKITVASNVSAGTPQQRTPPREVPPEQAFVATAVPVPDAPPSPETIGLTELENVQGMLRDFRTRMGENPVGSNAEIMRAVMGGNPAQARLGPPPGQSLNDAGELLDPWETPYFFHQLSATSMEVRSAGPDRKLWSTDDLVSH